MTEPKTAWGLFSIEMNITGLFIRMDNKFATGSKWAPKPIREEFRQLLDFEQKIMIQNPESGTLDGHDAPRLRVLNEQAPYKPLKNLII